MGKTPKIVDVQVIPVAGRDCMLMTLSGAHAPYFTRNIVILTDDSGNTGIGEIHGGEMTRQELEAYKPLLLGQEIGNYRAVVDSLFAFNRKKRMASSARCRRSSDSSGFKAAINLVRSSS